MAHAEFARRLIGRSAELDQLQTLLAGATDGKPCFVLLSGAAGVGKSSLLGEFAGRTEARVLLGSCLPLGEAGVPFAPIVTILRALETDAHGRRVPRSDLSDAVLGSTEPATRVQLFQTVLELLTSMGKRSPTVLIIEDLHWADRSTRDLLTFLILNMQAQHLLVAASYRTDDLHRDHPLRPLICELQRYPVVTRIDLDPLAAPLVAEQIADLTGAVPSPPVLTRVMERTQGNPYFVEQLVAAGCLDGQALPSSLRELLLLRTDAVSPPARRTLRVLSVADDKVTDESLARVAATPIDEVRDHIRESVDCRILVASSTGVDFTHALLREALQDDLLAGERVSCHAAFAEEIAAQPEDDRGGRAGSLARLAHHRAGAGDVDGAVSAWNQAATAAEDMFAFAEAHHHLDRVIAHWDRATSPAELAGASYAEVVARAAEDAFLSGDAESARDLGRQAIAALDASVEPRVAGVLHERLARYLRDTDEHDRAVECAQRAVELVPANPPSDDRARVLAGLAGQLMGRGRYVDAQALASEAVVLARQVGSLAAESDALNTLGVLTCTLTDVADGLAMMRAALSAAQRCGDAHQQMRSRWNEFACLFEAGEWDPALVASDGLTVELPRLGQAHLLPELFGNVADILMRLGRWDEAQATIDEANRRFPAHGDTAALIDLLVERGEFDEARRLIESTTARNVFTDQEQQGWPLVNLAALETWEGNRSSARAAVDAALEVTTDVDAPMARLYALAVGCRCEAEAAEHARLRNVAADEDLARTRIRVFVKQIDEQLARPGPDNGWKREARAIALQGSAEMSRADGTSDADAWTEATRAFERLAMPYPAAYTRSRAAEALFATTGERCGDTASLLGESHRVALYLGAEPLRHLIEKFARRARIDIGLSARDAFHGLSPREREVLALLGDGSTNKHIAATLFISEKTASVHVSNIMGKLGASNRGEAAAVAHREGITS
jgi:DNA-binding CsgD family transcriptional regulator/tetratricopeptide (TPR) repeat protein